MEPMQNNAVLERPLSTPDQATFDRVWNRVMSQSGQASGSESTPMADPAQLPVIPPNTFPAPLEPPVPRNIFPAPSEPVLPRPAAAAREPDMPIQYDVSCLGASSMQYTPLLREMMDGAYGIWNAYRAMTRQGQGMSARQLRALTEDQQRALRQLGAVYFLITGERYSHSPLTPPLSVPLNTALREMFVREQRWRRAYIQAVHQVEDPCLSILFDELAGKTELHMDAIRRILEGL